MLSWNTVSMEIGTQQSQQTPESLPAQTPPPTNPSKPRLWKISIIIFSAILVIALAGISIMLSLQQKNKSATPLDNALIQKIAKELPIPKITMIPITLAPTSSSQPTVGPTTSPTQSSSITPIPQNWSIYNNTSFNFSLSYPSELTTQENSHGLGVTDIAFATAANIDSQNLPEYQILIYPKTIGKLIGQDFDEFYSLPAQSTQLMTSQASAPQQFTKNRNITINSFRAFEYTTTSSPPNPNEESEIGIYIEIGENTLIISTGESNKTTLDYMLSTFKSPNP